MAVGRYWNPKTKKYYYKELKDTSKKTSTKTTSKKTTSPKTVIPLFKATAKVGGSTNKTNAMNQSISSSFKKANTAVKEASKSTKKTTPKSTVDFHFENFFAPKIDRTAEKESIGKALGRANTAGISRLQNDGGNTYMPKSTNIVYNKNIERSKKNALDGRSDLFNPYIEHENGYRQTQNSSLVPEIFLFLSADKRKEWADKRKNEVYEKAKTKRAQIAVEERRKRQNQEALENVIKRYQTEASINLDNPENREALHVVQRLAGIDESDTVTQALLNTLQDYMVSGHTNFEFDDYSLTKDNFATLLEAAKVVEENPHVNKNAAKAIELLFDLLANPYEAAAMKAIELIGNLVNRIG